MAALLRGMWNPNPAQRPTAAEALQALMMIERHVDDEDANLSVAEKQLQFLLAEQPHLEEMYKTCVIDGPMDIDEFIESFGDA